MNCYIIVGMTGQGKSHFTKKMIAGKHCFVFDVQNEYTDLSLNWQDSRARDVSLDEKAFVAKCKQKINSVLVFEEATGFFEGKLDKDVRRVVLSKRHTHNVPVFCFHSISAIPPRLMQLANFVVLFKTGDEPYQVYEKFPSIYPYYVKVREELGHQQFLIIKTIPQ